MIGIERRFLPILAAVGLIILVHQALDLVSLTEGADLGTPTGRLGVVAILWTRGPALLTGDLFLILAALLAPWARALAMLAAVHLVAGVAALVEAPFFLADAGQMAGDIALPGLASFRITVIRILAALIVLGVGAGVVGINLTRAAPPKTKAA